MQFNKEVTMADVIEIERLAKLRIPASEIGSRLKLPHWRIIEICKNQRIAVKP